MNAAALATLNTETLVHMCIIHAEGTEAGDAAWIALQLRAGFSGGLALIEAEKEARDLDVWSQRRPRGHGRLTRPPLAPHAPV